jgi:hypothetical protein
VVEGVAVAHSLTQSPDKPNEVIQAILVSFV